MVRTLAGVACLALALAGAAASGLRFAREKPAEKALSTYSSLGEILTHRIQALGPRVSDRMPLATIVAAKADYDASADYGTLLAADRVLLLFAAGFLLHAHGGLVAAAAAVLLSFSAHDLNLYPDSGYLLLVLLTAGLVVWRARAPSPLRSALLAAAVGATLLWRSPLAFFAPALALFERATEPGASWKRRRGELLILALAPYLFLLPWIAMNWTVNRRLVIFEQRSASSNLISGALGLVQNVEGDLGALIDEPIDVTNTGAVVGWAARQVARHPLRFIRAYVLRVKYALSFHPWLALMAAAATWLFRKRREYRELAFLAAYFLAIHCFMTVEERYFWPLWPPLALLACSLPAGLRAAERPRDDSPEAVFASAALLGALALVLALCLHAEWTVLAFARGARGGRGDVEAQLSAALRANPDDAWLLQERGGERFRRGDSAGAAEDFARASALPPESPSSRLLRARAEALLGKPGLLLEWAPPAGERREDFQLRYDADILKALACLRLGRKAEARERLKAAREVFGARNILVRGPQGEREKYALDKLRSSDAWFIRYCRQLQGPRPASEMRALDEALAALVQDPSELRIPRAEALPADDESRDRATALGYQDLKEYDRAIGVFDRLIRRRPAAASFRSDKAVCEHLKGDDDAALADLRAAIRLEPAFLPAYLTAGAIHVARGRIPQAVSVYDEALSKSPAAKADPLRRSVLAARKELTK
jgi:tetratricopeptide (TPR) repeat protein